MKCKMTARARVNPTEDVDKVIKAISNIFEFDELEIGDGYVVVTGEKESSNGSTRITENQKDTRHCRENVYKGF